MEAKPEVGSSTAPTLPLTQEFDHRCKWVSNCIRHSNCRVFMLLVQSLCLYSDAMLVTCLIFLVRTITCHSPRTRSSCINQAAEPPWGAVGRVGTTNGLGHGGEASGGRGSREKPPGRTSLGGGDGGRVGGMGGARKLCGRV